MPQLDTLMDRTFANLDRMIACLVAAGTANVDPQAAAQQILLVIAMQEPAEA